MPQPETKRNEKDLTELVKDLLITQLGLAGVSQRNIQKIVGCDINRVSDILKFLKVKQSKKKK